MINKRLEDIIKEAVQTKVISRITYQEREDLGKLYKEHTGEDLEILCNACIMKACNKLYKIYDNEQEKNIKSRRGRNGSHTRRN